MSDVRLLDADQLERSAVVANNAMNRTRNLAGVNSYAKDLGFEPTERLRAPAAWLDLCCGSGRALNQAAGRRLTLVGVDLVAHFEPPGEGVTFVTAALREWEPERPFDLITCVHGLHYVGDKLEALSRALRWLAPGGCFAGHLDLQAFKRPDGTALARTVGSALRAAGVAYDSRRHLVTCDGPRELSFDLAYLGADDRAGPNFTGQPAVDSYYERA